MGRNKVMGVALGRTDEEEYMPGIGSLLFSEVVFYINLTQHLFLD
jgi:hypothetical protein